MINKEIALASTLTFGNRVRISSHRLLSCARSCVLIFTVTAHRSLYLQWPVVFKTLHPQRVRALVRIAFMLRWPINQSGVKEFDAIVRSLPPSRLLVAGEYCSIGHAYAHKCNCSWLRLVDFYAVRPFYRVLSGRDRCSLQISAMVWTLPCHRTCVRAAGWRCKSTSFLPISYAYLFVPRFCSINTSHLLCVELTYRH